MRLITTLMVLLLTAAMFGGVIGFFLILYFSKDLPDYEQLANYEPPHVTRLYTGDGRILEEYAVEKRMFVPIGAIPKRLQQAFLAAEDRTFYENPGIDFVGIGRAVVTNLNNVGKGRSLVGGSTITQQVVKNFLLTNEQSFERKIKEAILAFRITNTYSKDKILELYLNEIYLGVGSYGVAAAALTYFNKSIDELKLEEGALLAALPKAPARLDPRHNYERAKERRDWVIRRMQDDGYITNAEAERAISMPILLKDRDEEELASAPNFAEEVRRQIAKMYGSDVLYKGGLTVHTTLRPELQARAQEALLSGLAAYERRYGYRGPIKRTGTTNEWLERLKDIEKPQGAIPWRIAMVLGIKGDTANIGFKDASRGVIALKDIKWARKRSKSGIGPAVEKISDVLRAGDVILVKKLEDEEEGQNRYGLRQAPKVDGALVSLDPHTGRVMAMVGGAGFQNVEFNRATQAQRQPGSAFKPFVYLSALENGYTPSSIILDAPIELYQGPGLPMWRPQNYSGEFYGPSTLRVGVEKSRNVMTVRLAQRLGINRVNEIGMRFGIYDKPTRNYSMVLGSAETTLANLTAAYAALVNGGKKVEPILIEKIQDRHGRMIFASDARECPGCRMDSENQQVSETVPLVRDTREILTDPMSAYQMVSILEGVVQAGTSVKAQKIGKPIGGKTGTTNDSIDSWFIGFTPDLVTGVFVGYDQPKTLGRKETGASVALPIFVDFMTAALEDQPSTPFRIPPGIKLMKVDRATGLRPSPATPSGRIIFEAFKPGTEPTGMSPMYADEPSIPAYDPNYQPYYIPESDPAQPAYDAPPTAAPRQSPTVGTGGLY